MKPTLLVLQFHEGDRDQAMALARLLADILRHNEHHILFFARYDCEHDIATIRYCRQYFHTVLEGRSTRRIKGWPIGPNAMAMDVFQLSHEKHKAGEWDYESIMLLESDCVPLNNNWLELIRQEWREGNQLLLGHWIGKKADPARSHMNGNLMFSPRLTFTVPALLEPRVPVLAWDVYFWKAYSRFARASKLIYSDYRVKFTTCEDLFAPRKYEKGHPLGECQVQPAWLHGCKDSRAMGCVRDKLLP